LQAEAAIPAVPGLWDPPAFFLVTTGPRIVLSARLLSLSGIRNKDNYADGAVMPVSAVRGGSAAGQGGALAA
ncbi:MAG: hypothetical protein ACRDND_33250, partial [Streptosporangiaceae bacterium]